MLIPTIFDDFPTSRPTKGVLHIGAHECEEAPLYHSIGMKNEDILWIEANADIINPEQKNILHAVISNKDDENVSFIITNNIQSSSILELHTHLLEHPHVVEIGRRNVTTITLDTLFRKNHIPFDKYDFMNLDIQGAELKALQGATEVLPHIRAIYTEVNVKELYKGCAFLEDLDLFLVQYGFKRVATQILHHGWGDALYIKDI
jgi:FkbM family methyltransferase